ncbi:MAG: hypothetical protein PHS80_03005 [Methanothrix sp.]|nr:hypothetical protein [Methanothrix sp.]MDD4448458.1 hypothetical protein [Methanothrix sp.]
MNEARWNKPISVIMPVRKSIKNTVIMVDTVVFSASWRISSIVNSCYYYNPGLSFAV